MLPRALADDHGVATDGISAEVVTPSAAGGADVVYALFIEPRSEVPKGWSQSERCVDWESCLSVPGFAALVERPQRVQVEYESLTGEATSATAAAARGRPPPRRSAADGG